MTGWIAGAGVILGILALIDMKKKQIPVLGIGVLFFVFLMGNLCTDFDMVELLLGLLPGGVALLLSYVTGGKLGSGDGFVLLAVGIGTGLYQTVFIWGIALFLAAVTAMVLLALKKVRRKTELPFVPCIFWGYVLCQCSGFAG